MKLTKQKGTLLLRRNLLLSEGLYAAAVSCFADSFRHAVILCFILAFLMLFAVPLTAILPPRVPAPVRTLVYSAVAALVYVPAVLSARILFPPAELQPAAVFLPLLIPGVLLSASRNELLAAKSLKSLLCSLLCCLAGITVSVLLFGSLRELLGSGTLFGRPIMSAAPLPILLQPGCGLILIAVCSAALSQLFRTEGE